MKNRKNARRIKRLSLIVTLCAIILVVSTYAWFIGMRTVNVSTFDVKIAATDGLTLSLDGESWAETVSINQGNYKTVYDNNTNTWGGDGLVPLSTVGVIDQDTSRLVMFEKGSLTATTGGYRLLASQIDNKTVTPGTEEGTGFVAFDLFVKNLSGNEYYKDFDLKNEEAIYLTQESKVEIANAGDKQDKTGIENSVRVAFAQIGRVEAGASTSTKAEILGITCNKGGTNDNVTGVCTKVAQIWEPNDTKHVENAINWYNTACKVRKSTGTDVNLSTSYGGTDNTETTDDDESKCISVVDGTAYSTYAINKEITVKDSTNTSYLTGVDVYDGYNRYTGTITAAEGAGTFTPLTDFDYFTDTEKMQVGLARPQFFSLAPNSITKIRVYVYIEGQDIDNYDFASLGRAIKVSFGFTKERFFDTDISYEGPTAVTKEHQGGTSNVVVPTTSATQS